MSIADAVAGGHLVDLTDMAKELGMICPAFMSSSLVARYESQLPDGIAVLANLSFYADLLCNRNYEIYGQVWSGEQVCFLEPSEEFGLVVLVLEKGKAEELDLKRTIQGRFEYAM